MSINAYNKSGFPCSIYHLPPKQENDDSENPLYIFISGNPGLLEFYVDFLTLIQEKKPEWEILGISHAGMNSCDTIECPVYSLEEQIQHNVNVIKSFSSEKRQLIIMGHSIGAFIAQKVAMHEDLEGRVIQVGLLTPTVIDIHLSEKGTKLTLINKWCPNFHAYVALLSWIFFEKLLPVSATRWIVSTFVDKLKTRMGAAVLVLLTNSRFVLQALGLAAQEMKLVRSNWEFQRKFVGMCNSENISIWMLFSKSDHWVSDKTRQDLIDFYEDNCSSKNLEIDISELIEHAFVRKHTEIVIDKYF